MLAKAMIFSSRCDIDVMLRVCVVGRSAEGGDEDQPVAVSAGQRHLSPGGRQELTHSIQRFQTYSITTR